MHALWSLGVNDEDTLRSAVSLVANQMAMQSDNADLARIEKECRRKIALRAMRTGKALEEFGGPVAEVDFEQMGQNWEAAVADLYHTLGLTFSSDARNSMRAEQRRAKKSDYRKHADDLGRIAPE